MDIVMWNNDKSKPILVLTCVKKSSNFAQNPQKLTTSATPQTKKRKIASVKIDLFESAKCEYEFNIRVKQSKPAPTSDSKECFMIVKPGKVGIIEPGIQIPKKNVHLSKKYKNGSSEKLSLAKRAHSDWPNPDFYVQGEENVNVNAHLNKIKKFLVGQDSHNLKFVKLNLKERKTF